MNATLGEHISAFLDGELPPREVELLLRRLQREPQLRAALSRYATIGELLRHEHGNLSPNFVAKVSRAIALERERLAPAAAANTAARGDWFRKAGQMAGGLALAATVAGVAILVLQREHSPIAQPGAEAQQDLQLIAEAPAVSRGPETVVLGNARGGEMYSYTVPAPVQTSALLPEARLTDYVFAHSEYSSPLGRRNVLSSMVAEDPTPVDPAETSRKETRPATDNNRRDGSPLFGDIR